MPQSVLNKLTLFSIILLTVIIILPGNLLAQNQIKSMKKNKQLIQKGFDQWTNGSASFFDLLADDVTWTITGNSPIAKTYNSRQQFLVEAITPLCATLVDTLQNITKQI